MPELDRSSPSLDRPSRRHLTGALTIAVAPLIASGCRPSPPAPPPAPAAPASTAPLAPPLVTQAAQRGGCQPAGGGAGVDLDGRCVPIAMVAGGWGGAAARPDHPALAQVRAAGCEPDSNLARGDGAVFVHVTCGGRGAVPGYVMRVDDAGVQARVAVPAAGGARVSVVTGARPLVVVVLDGVGTMALDAATLDGLAGWERMGGWFNATTEGAAPSPDGAWFAVPDPYGGHLDVVRVADLRVAASVSVRELAARDQGPGRIEWTGAGLRVTTFRLPYE